MGIKLFSVSSYDVKDNSLVSVGRDEKGFPIPAPGNPDPHNFEIKRSTQQGILLFLKSSIQIVTTMREEKFLSMRALLWWN